MNRSDWTHTVLNELDSDLVEAAAAPVKQRIRLRPALILSACLCLLLLGTAVASESFSAFPIFRAVRERTDDGSLRAYRDGWEVTVETHPIPLSAFSRAARTFPEIGEKVVTNDSGAMQGFDSLAEAEEFLGIELLDNPVLDSAQPAQGFSITRGDGSDLPVYALLSRRWNKEDALTSVSVVAAFRMAGEEEGAETTLHVNISLRTDAAGAGSEVVTTSLNRPGTSYSTQEYTAPSGLMAILVEVTEPWEEEERVDYIANFSYRGAAFRIQAYCPTDPKSALSTLKQVLDAFQ